MNKRLRKKLRRHEYRQYGFAVKVWLREPWVNADQADDDEIWNLFIEFADAIEHDHLYVGGGLGQPWDLWVTKCVPGRFIVGNRRRWTHRTCTEADRELVAATLAAQSSIVDRYEIGELSDTWE